MIIKHETGANQNNRHIIRHVVILVTPSIDAAMNYLASYPIGMKGADCW